MKKILATLIVATMLLSCVSVIGFAYSATLYTDAVFGTNSLITIEEKQSGFTKVKSFVGAGAAYQTQSYAIIGDPLLEQTTTLAYKMNMCAAMSFDTSYFADVTFPYEFTSGEVVAVPIYADGDGISDGGIYVKYDTELFEAVATTDFPSGAVNASKKDGYSFVGWAEATADGAQTGYLGSLFFKVKDISEVAGDANGKKVAEFVISLEDDGALGGGSSEKIGSLGSQLTCSVNLKGLKATTVTKPEATDADLAAAYSVDAVGGADDYQAIVDKGIEIVEGNAVYDYNAWGNYKIFFGKFVADTYKQPTAQGFIIKGGKADVKAAAKTTFKAGAPFGILVFGMGENELTATPFIEY